MHVFHAFIGEICICGVFTIVSSGVEVYIYNSGWFVLMYTS